MSVYKNLCGDEKLIAKLSKHLPKFLQIFMENNCDEALRILTKFAIFDDNRKMMIENNVTNIVIEKLKSGNLPACLFIVAMSSNLEFFKEILNLKIYEILIDCALNENFEWTNREKFLITFQKLINLQGLSELIEISSKISKMCSQLMKISLPFNILLTLLTILEKLAIYSDMKEKISEIELAKAVFTSITLSSRSSMLIIRLLNLIAIFIDQESFRKAFHEFSACEFLHNFLKSPAFQLRASACNLINMASNYSDLCTEMINEGILKFLSENFECSLCSDGFEMMLNMDLSMKFAIRRRLEVSDKISSGFYASKEKMDFMVLRRVMQSSESSPYRTVFSINFDGELENGRILME